MFFPGYFAKKKICFHLNERKRKASRFGNRNQKSAKLSQSLQNSRFQDSLGRRRTLNQIWAFHNLNHSHLLWFLSVCGLLVLLQLLWILMSIALLEMDIEKKTFFFNTYFTFFKQLPYSIPIVKKHVGIKLLKLGIVTIKLCLCHKHSIKQYIKYCAIMGQKGWNLF